MRVQQVHLSNFRGFSDLHIEGLGADTRLVVLAGPNGRGKSSLFDAFRIWQGRWLYAPWDMTYHAKIGAPVAPSASYLDQVRVDLFGPPPSSATAAHRSVYLRTAQRIEADFDVTELSLGASAQDNSPRINKSTDVDAAVSANYQDLVKTSLAHLYGPDRERSVGSIQEELLGPLRSAMSAIFPDLQLENISDPMGGGAFYFSKGSSRKWHYRNLSGGERAAFDLLLDMAMRAEVFSDSIFCIDEPEAHLNTRVQGALLEQMMILLPRDSQMWVATHSLGMLTAAKRRLLDQGDVAFLDFGQGNFDQSVVMAPAVIDRAFWRRTLHVALDDMANLVAPQKVVLVEGRPKWDGKVGGNAEFDAACLRTVFFGQVPDVEFISVGNSDDVTNDKLKVTETTAVIAPGTEVLRVVDRDDLDDGEVSVLRAGGIRTLSHRDLENYLMADDVLEAYSLSQGEGVSLLVDERNRLLEALPDGRASDDFKAVAGDLYNFCKARFRLTQKGNTAQAFMRNVLATYVRPEMVTFKLLYQDIFGEVL